MRVWLALFFLFASCNEAPSPRAVNDRSGQALKIGMRRPPDSLNPYLSLTQEGEYIAALLYPTLYRETPRVEAGFPILEPVLVKAARWEDRGLRLELELRDDLKWSDGEPLTSADVAFSLGLQKDERLAWVDAATKDGIKGWVENGPHALTVMFQAVSPFNLMNLNEGFILPKHKLDPIPREKWEEVDWNKPEVVFGPFKVRDFLAGEQLLLEPLSGKGRAISLAFVKDQESLFQMLSAGQLDYAWGLQVERLGDIRAKLKPVVWDDLSFAFLAWNPIQPEAMKVRPPKTLAELRALKRDAAHPLFSDVRVRRALTLALDLNDYNLRFWGGMARVPASPWRGGLAYLQYKAVPVVHDPEQAGRLLDEAGWKLKNGVRMRDSEVCTVKILCNLGSSVRENYLVAIQQDLGAIGVKVELEMLEPGLYTQRCRDRHFDVMFGTLRAGTRPDLRAMFGSEAALEGGFNFSSWLDLDGALIRAEKAATGAALQDALRELEMKFLAEQPMTMLYEGVMIGASHKDGPIPLSNYLNPLWDVQNW